MPLEMGAYFPIMERVPSGKDRPNPSRQADGKEQDSRRASVKKSRDPLKRWLSLEWNRPERSYHPDLKDFLTALIRLSEKTCRHGGFGAERFPGF
jgi:hypothetical protein